MPSAPNDPLDVVDWPVATGTLRLRRATPDDADAVWRYWRLPEVNQYLPRASTDPEEFRAFFTEPSRLARAVVVELHGQVVADLMLRIGDAWAPLEVAEHAKGVQAELGWAADPAITGRGLATEAVQALVAVCFGPLGLRRVVASAFTVNTRSVRMMERLGMRRETAAIKAELNRSLEWVDSYTYALLREEWLTDRA